MQPLRATLAGLALVAGTASLTVLAAPSSPGDKGQPPARMAGGAVLPEPSGPIGMPQGILLKTARIGEALEVAGSSSSQPEEKVIFANDRSRALYTYAKDTPGQPSTCVDACAELWPAALAPDGVAAPADKNGLWSVIARPDGKRQWALRGMPLYTYAKDVDAEKERGRGPAGAEGQGVDGAWFAAEVRPDRWMVRPAGIKVAEAMAAPGRVLVTDKGRTLYAYEAKSTDDRALLDRWMPLRAAQLDLPVGDFQVIERKDGFNQWSWRGKPLYTFRDDMEDGDLNGAGLVAGMEPAVVLRYFKPTEVAIVKDQRRGGLLVEASTGRTLYARDRVIYNGTGSHYGRGVARGFATTGLSIGVTGCDKNCEQTWKPLLAPPDAKNWGNWTVLDRTDGTRQWAYLNYALYTNVEERPGEVAFHDAYDIELNHDPDKPVPANHGFSLYWRAAPP